MSAADASCVTHDSVIGKKPTVNLCFPVIWKIREAENCQVRNNWVSVITTPNVRDWEFFRRDLFAPYGDSDGDVVTYVDSDDDEIPIESQCELDEALRIATQRAATAAAAATTGQSSQANSFHLVVYRGSERGADRERKRIGDRATAAVIRADMTPTNLTPGVASRQRRDTNVRLPDTATNYNVREPENSDDTPPKWFTCYMQRMKDDIVAEVSKRVTGTVFEAMKQKKRENRQECETKKWCDCDTEYSVDECDTENSTGKLRSSNENECCGKKSRRRYRNVEKQQRGKKHGGNGKWNGSTDREATLSRRPVTGISHPRGEEDVTRKITPHFDEQYFSRASPRGWRSCYSRCTTDPWPKKSRDSEKSDEDSRRACRTEVSRNFPEAPILKLRASNLPRGEEQSGTAVGGNDETLLRMGCSVTGAEALESRTERSNEFCDLSDSDNISIISDISQNSEYQRPMSNSFEMMVERSYDRVDEVNDPRDFVTGRRVEGKEQRGKDDQEANRDSSSFELLSEPPSPALSIHMDEDHFSPGLKDPSNYNINANIEKPDAPDKLDSCALVIDVQGRIHDGNSDGGYPGEIIFEKRTDGSYSFVADNLPGSTKESVAQDMKEEPSDSLDDDVTIKVDDSASEKETPGRHNGTHTRDESPIGDAFHESTQSFHSHTAPQSGNERHDFSYSSGTPGTHIFVDVNVSKGLGDTRRSTASASASSSSSSSSSFSRTREFANKDCGFPNKKREFAKKEREFANEERDRNTSEKTTSPRKEAKGPTRSSSSAKGMGNSPTGENTNKFGPWSTMRNTRMIDEMVFNDVDPLHILPESLVTGAVHVAASALTTARRVYDKLLTAQTRKSTVKTKFGRR